MADVPRNTQVYLGEPVLGVSERNPGSRGPDLTRIQVLNGAKSLLVHRVAWHADTLWTHIRVRSIECGELSGPFSVRRV